MSVNFSHCNASWSYTDFAKFRQMIAEQVGIPLKEMIGHGGEKGWDEYWSDSICLFLNLPDGGGSLTPIESKEVWTRLKSIRTSYSRSRNTIIPTEQMSSHAYNLMELINGLEESVRRNETFQLR